MLVIDLSLSMTQPIGVSDGSRAQALSDTGPARIEAVKQALRTFIQRRPNDRFGVVVFSDNSYVVSPLTVRPRTSARLFQPHRSADSLVGEGRTAMGDGIDTRHAAAAEAVDIGAAEQGADGVHRRRQQRGRDPIQSLEDATRAGTRVHVIGVDLEQERKQSPKVRRFHRGDSEAQGAATTRLNPRPTSRMPRDRSTSSSRARSGRTSYVRNEPLVQWFALPALAMLLLAVGLRAVPTFIGLH